MKEMPWVCLQFVIVVFPEHTHYFSYQAQMCMQSYLVGIPCTNFGLSFIHIHTLGQNFFSSGFAGKKSDLGSRGRKK